VEAPVTMQQMKDGSVGAEEVAIKIRIRDLTTTSNNSGITTAVEGEVTAPEFKEVGLTVKFIFFCKFAFVIYSVII